MHTFYVIQKGFYLCLNIDDVTETHTHEEEVIKYHH